MIPIDLSIAAKVKYIGTENNSRLTVNKIYDAYFIEYWEGERKSLHVRGNDGEITDFNEFYDFVIIEDAGNALNFYEAKVKCVTGKFQEISEKGYEYISMRHRKEKEELCKDKLSEYKGLRKDRLLEFLREEVGQPDKLKDQQL